jgi:ATP-dependent Clp protease ATP-binding subunit ClpB
MELEMSEEAIDWLAEHGFDPQSGARPVKRLIQKVIVNELSKEIISGRILRDSKVKISVDKDKLKFSVA